MCFLCRWSELCSALRGLVEILGTNGATKLVTLMESRTHSNMEVPKLGYPLNQPFIEGLSIVNNPFWVSSIYGNPHIQNLHLQQAFQTDTFFWPMAPFRMKPRGTKTSTQDIQRHRARPWRRCYKFLLQMYRWRYRREQLEISKETQLVNGDSPIQLFTIYYISG
jgi:hypothetical protein